MTQHWIRCIVFMGQEYDTKIDLQCTGLVGPQSIYIHVYPSLHVPFNNHAVLHASIQKSRLVEASHIILSACYNAILYGIETET